MPDPRRAKPDRSKRAREAIDRSTDEDRLVHLTRTIRGVGPTDGVVVTHGIRWVVVNRLSPDLDLDGCTAVRWKHVKKAHLFDPGSLPSRAVHRTSLPSVPSSVADATTTRSLLRSLEAQHAPVTLHTELTKPTCAITVMIAGIVARSVLVAPMFPMDRPAHHIEVPFEHVTRIDFGTRHLAGIARAAAACPPLRSAPSPLVRD